MAREGEYFYRGENEVGRTITNKESITFHWLVLARKEEKSFLFLLGSAMVTGYESSLFWGELSTKFPLSTKHSAIQG